MSNTGSFHVKGVINATDQAGYTVELIPALMNTTSPSVKSKKIRMLLSLMCEKG